jgi:rubrerythrin
MEKEERVIDKICRSCTVVVFDAEKEEKCVICGKKMDVYREEKEKLEHP